MSEKPWVEIFTDGACSGNPGPGGWAAVLIYNGKEKEISGSDAYTTNNRMEMTAAISGLKTLKLPCRVSLASDSAYLVNGFNSGWLLNWQRNGWKNSRKEPVENKDLWEQLLELCKIHDVQWVKVKGHADNKYNNRCDELAVAAINELRKNTQPS